MLQATAECLLIVTKCLQISKNQPHLSLEIKEQQASFIKATSIVTKQAWNEITVTTCEIDGFICKTCKDDLQPDFYFQNWGPFLERPGHF